MTEVTTNATKVLAGLDLELLDSQITSLHQIEEHEALNAGQREAVTGLCEFLSLLYAALDVSASAGSRRQRRLRRAQVEHYVRSSGVRCPFCGSDALDSGQPSTTCDDGVLHATCRCGRCRAEWVDEYRLVGISGESFEVVENRPRVAGSTPEPRAEGCDRLPLLSSLARILDAHQDIEDALQRQSADRAQALADIRRANRRIGEEVMKHLPG